MNIYPNLLNKQLYKVPTPRTARWETVDFTDVDTTFEIKKFPLLADTVRNITDNIDEYGKITVTPTDVLSFYCDTSKYVEGVYEEGYGSAEAPFADINYALRTIWCILNTACFKVKAVLHIVNDVTTDGDIFNPRFGFNNCLLIDGLRYNGENCKLTCARMPLSEVYVKNLDIKSNDVSVYSLHNCNIEARITTIGANVYATLLYKSKIIHIGENDDYNYVFISSGCIIESSIGDKKLLAGDKQVRFYIETLIIKESEVYAYSVRNIYGRDSICIIANSGIIARFISSAPAIIFKCTESSFVGESEGCCIVDCTLSSNTNTLYKYHRELLMLNSTLHADNHDVIIRYMENSTIYGACNFYMNGGMRGSSVTMTGFLSVHAETYSDTEYVFNDNSFTVTISGSNSISPGSIVYGRLDKCTEVRDITVDIFGDSSPQAMYSFRCTNMDSASSSQVTINAHLNTMKVLPEYSETYGDIFKYIIYGKSVGSPCQVNFIGEVECVGEHKTQLFRTLWFSVGGYPYDCGTIGIEKYDTEYSRRVTVYDGVKVTLTETDVYTGATITEVGYLCEQPDDGSDDE